ncbi:MAG: hypothetical protein KGD63_01945 [Candidatus Lokiarchaeota archaeon]|nr:hypothetical protein [Candidatus Lokiarchaeota archaeon]
MSEKYKEFLKKIHNNKKSDIPEYITITIRLGKKKKLIDIKIRKEDSNILKVMGHEAEAKGWFLSSVHIPLKNLGLSNKTKNKEILQYLNNPEKIMSDKYTKNYLVELLKKYLDIQADSKNHFFRTERYKVKKQYSTGGKVKSM